MLSYPGRLWNTMKTFFWLRANLLQNQKKNMMAKSYDLIIIGGVAGVFAAAIKTNDLNAKTQI